MIQELISVCYYLYFSLIVCAFLNSYLHFLVMFVCMQLLFCFLDTQNKIQVNCAIALLWPDFHIMETCKDSQFFVIHSGFHIVIDFCHCSSHNKAYQHMQCISSNIHKMIAFASYSFNQHVYQERRHCCLLSVRLQISLVVSGKSFYSLVYEVSRLEIASSFLDREYAFYTQEP